MKLAHHLDPQAVSDRKAELFNAWRHHRELEAAYREACMATTAANAAQERAHADLKAANEEAQACMDELEAAIIADLLAKQAAGVPLAVHPDQTRRTS